MEIIVLMNWSIWITRNEWTFSNSAHSVQGVKRHFTTELRAVAQHKVNSQLQEDILDWLDAL
uniref:Uncharacterized protein n=1 Tax=Setaria viridis TaxID=4556 RepID=A0A4U6TBA7_SETVI|nr:hypothetical protein SEVIR_9G511550v2 [Setaria viridis]